MIMKNKSTKYLSYIEDTRKQHNILLNAAKRSAKKAIEDSHHKSVPVTYLEGNDIITVTKNGKKTIIASLENHRRKVDVGAKSKLR